MENAAIRNFARLNPFPLWWPAALPENFQPWLEAGPQGREAARWSPIPFPNLDDLPTENTRSTATLRDRIGSAADAHCRAHRFRAGADRTGRVPEIRYFGVAHCRQNPYRR